MNIFYLDRRPDLAASFHCDKHCGKMLIESCQMLASAHHYHGNGAAIRYRPTHINHPCTIWVRAAPVHYAYVRDLALALGEEFLLRYGKIHASAIVLRDELIEVPVDMYALGTAREDPPQAMPDAFKSVDTVAAYRKYYASKAATMPLVYYRGQHPQPDWLREEREQKC